MTINHGPSFVGVYPINYCNTACRFCLFEQKKIMPLDSPSFRVVEHFQGKKPLLEFEIYENLINSLLRLGGLHQVSLIGVGEPTLHPHLGKMVRLVKGLKPDCLVEVFSNGLFSKEIGDELVVSGLNTISISVNAFDEKSYQAVNPSGGAEAFNKIIDNIKYLRKYSDLSIRIGVVITSTSAFPLKVQNFFQDIGADCVRYSPLIPPPGWEDHLTPFELDASQYRQFFSEYDSLREHFDEQKLQLLSFMNDKGIISTSRYYRNNPCFMGDLYTVLTSDGEIKGCGQSMRVLGNLHESDFVSIWRSEKYAQYRKECRNILNTGGSVENCFCDKCTYVTLNRDADYYFKTYASG